MAKPPIPVGSVKVAQHGTLGPTNWVNVFYLTADGAGHTPGEVIAQASGFIENFYTTVMSMGQFPTNWATQWQTVTYRDAPDSTVRVRVADAHAGTDVTGDQDAQVSYLMNWSTGDPRRGGKPRTYVAGVRDGSMADPAFLVSGHVSAITARAITWLESGPTLPIPLQLVEMSFRNGNAWRADALTYPIIGASLNPVVATQRRRVDRVRPA